MRTVLVATLTTAAWCALVGCHDQRGAATPAAATTASHEPAPTPATPPPTPATPPPAPATPPPAPAALIAVLQPTKGNQAAGRVAFSAVAEGVRIVADLSGLTPGAKHAIHLHEFGDVSADDGSAAGGHYNPAADQHGAPEGEHHHAGDLGNLTADAAGNAHYELLVKGLSLTGGAMPVIGRSVIIHAKEDDLASQPAGNAGPRIAQGVIGIGK